MTRTEADPGQETGVHHLASQEYRRLYRNLLAEAQKECPTPDSGREKGRRGRLVSSKARNLQERLRDFKDDVMRFTVEQDVPFANNQAENDIRMTNIMSPSGLLRYIAGVSLAGRG